jgi:hypothetical protein
MGDRLDPTLKIVARPDLCICATSLDTCPGKCATFDVAIHYPGKRGSVQVGAVLRNRPQRFTKEIRKRRLSRWKFSLYSLNNFDES